MVNRISLSHLNIFFKVAALSAEKIYMRIEAGFFVHIYTEAVCFTFQTSHDRNALHDIVI